MGMSTSIIGVRDLRQQFDKMWKAKEACEQAGIGYPEEVKKYFVDYINESKPAVESEMLHFDLKNTSGVTLYNNPDAASVGYEVDIRKLPKDVKIIRFYNSW